MGLDLTAGTGSASKHLVLVEGTIEKNPDYVMVCDPANGLVQNPIGTAYHPKANVSGTFDRWVLEAHFPPTAQSGFKDQ
jgi:hypothetical protein